MNKYGEKGCILTKNLLFSDNSMLYVIKCNKLYKLFKFNGFYTKDNFNATSNLKFMSFFKFRIIIFVHHIWFSATPNNTCPWIGVEKFTPGIHLNTSPLHLIYESVHDVHLSENHARPRKPLLGNVSPFIRSWKVLKFHVRFL